VGIVRIIFASRDGCEVVCRLPMMVGPSLNSSLGEADEPLVSEFIKSRERKTISY
jgi:hypothetical protein